MPTSQAKVQISVKIYLSNYEDEEKLIKVGGFSGEYSHTDGCDILTNEIDLSEVGGLIKVTNLACLLVTLGIEFTVKPVK